MQISMNENQTSHHMKVLLIASYANSLANFRGPLLKALLAEGCEVHGAAPNASEILRNKAGFERVVWHNYPLQRAGMNPVSDIKSFWRLYRLIRHVQPDVILPYTIKPVIYGLLAARLAGVSHRFALITGLGYVFVDGRNGFLSGVVRRLYKLALARAEKVFFQNPDDEALFRSLGILSPGVPSVVVNGSGVDLAHYAVESPPTDPSFLLIARLLGDKGVREYVEAARRVRASYPDVVFHLVGAVDENPDSVTQPELDSWVEEGMVNYWGRLVDVRPAIAKAAVYVLPSYAEGTPRTVLEAMSMGRAVITTDAPGCRETVIEGENGYLVPVKSIDALVEAMLRFVQQPDLIAQMGQRSREIAEKKYDVHKVNAVMLKEMGITF